MEYYFAAEPEAKLLTNSSGLECAEKSLAELPDGPRSYSHMVRDHVYYDLPGLPLLRNDLSFRRTVGKPTYCFKYPVRTEHFLSIRREIMLKCASPLNILDPLQHRTPIFARLLPVLLDMGYGPAEWVDFAPTVRIRTTRRQALMYTTNVQDLSLSIALDRVEAHNVSVAEHSAVWHEVEIEAADATAMERANAIVERLLALGLKVSNRGKYRTGADLLWPKGTS